MQLLCPLLIFRYKDDGWVLVARKSSIEGVNVFFGQLDVVLDVLQLQQKSDYLPAAAARRSCSPLWRGCCTPRRRCRGRGGRGRSWPGTGSVACPPAPSRTRGRPRTRDLGDSHLVLAIVITLRSVGEEL